MFPIVSPQIFKVTLDNIGTPVVRAHLLSPFVTTLRGGAEANFRSHGLELGDLNWYHIFKVYYLGLREYTIQIWLIIIYYILLWLDVVQYLNFRYLNGPLIHYRRIYIYAYMLLLSAILWLLIIMVKLPESQILSLADTYIMCTHLYNI